MDNPPLDELRSRSLTDAALALTSAKGVILHRWREAVAEVIPESDELTRRQFEDSIPELLDRISAALASDVSATTDELIALSPAHGRTRFHQEFSLNQLLIEYHLLRRIVLGEMSGTLERALTVEESIAVNQAIDVALRQSAVSYADQKSAELKIETAAMTKFLSFLSHDLRGGLNGAVLMIEVLKRDLASDQRHLGAVEDLEVVRRSMLDTVTTMERFLNAEKLRHGRMPVHTAEINVAEMLDELHKGFAYHLLDAGMEMEIAAQPGLRIRSDRQLLVMVLQNLISNAIKYGRRGKVRISAISDGQAPPDVKCRFTVTDNGPGIAPEKLADLFAPFSRGETYGQRGIGLGLFIARQAADLLGAKLWAEFAVGQGTSFMLDLTQA